MSVDLAREVVSGRQRLSHQHYCSYCHRRRRCEWDHCQLRSSVSRFCTDHRHEQQEAAARVAAVADPQTKE